MDRISPGSMSESFKFDTTIYGLRTKTVSSEIPKAVSFGTETIAYRCNLQMQPNMEHHSK